MTNQVGVHFENLLKSKNYQLNPKTNVWQHPNYAGINYSDGDTVENRLLEIISAAEDVTVLSPELRGNCQDWASLYHLSSSRANVLRPFCERIKGNILEIGAGCGAITRYLGECGAQILALEGSPRRAAIARARTRDLDNVTVMTERFSDFRCDQKFDVITLIGVFEYANLFTPDENPPLSMLRRVRSLLKPDGLLLIAIENQLGLKYFAGAGEDHVGTPMFGIEDRYTTKSVRTFGRNELDRLLSEAGFHSTEFMGCFPDYKLPCSIITKSGFDHPEFDAGALASQSTAKDHLKPEYRCFSSELAWPKIIQNGLGLDLANSFLIAASQESTKSPTKDILGYHYSSERLPEFSKETIFKVLAEDKISVECKSLKMEISQLSAKKSLNGGELIFKVPPVANYAKGHPVSAEFVRIVSRPGWSMVELQEYFNKYLVLISKLSHRVPPLAPEDLVDGKLIDCIPNNLIEHRDGTLEFIDTEWIYSSPISIKRLIFRALLGVISIPSDYALDHSGKTYTYGEFFLRIFESLDIPMTLADLESLLNDEIQLQETVTGSRQDLTKTREFFGYRMPHKKYSEITPFYAQKIDELQSELHAIKSSKKWRYALKISNMIPRFVKSSIKAIS